MGLAIAVFAALGVERVLAGDSRAGIVIGGEWQRRCFMLLGVSGGLTSMATTLAVRRRRRTGCPLERRRARGSARCARSSAAALTLGVLFAMLAGKLKPDRRIAWALAALVVALDLWSVERLYWQFSPPAAQLYASDAIIDTIKAAKEPSARARTRAQSRMRMRDAIRI